jgi:hypothetical protein
MFDLNTVPKIVVKEISYKDIDIALEKIGQVYKPNRYFLYNRGSRWMVLDAYTNKEIKEMYSMYDMAQGDVMLTGFGFGILAAWIATKPEVTSVTVLEVSQDIVDIFLLNNTMPEKVNVIITDASSYTTDKHYDCLFLDHYEHQYSDWLFRNVKQISKNIPNHDILWFWSLESRSLEAVSDLNDNSLAFKIMPQGFTDLYPMYQSFKTHILDVATLPELDKFKFNEYAYTYFDKLGYSVF